MSVGERFRSRYFGPEGIIEGVRVCLSQEHTASALGLVCAAVESMAYLALTPERDEVSDMDMIAWVDKYLQPEKMGISGKDLWQVRCSLLNRRLWQRETIQAGKVREVLFAWGKYSIQGGMELRPGSRWSRIMLIHASELYKALYAGTEAFCNTYIASPENAYIVTRRMNQVFGEWRPRIGDVR